MNKQIENLHVLIHVFVVVIVCLACLLLELGARSSGRGAVSVTASGRASPPSTSAAARVAALVPAARASAAVAPPLVRQGRDVGRDAPAPPRRPPFPRQTLAIGGGDDGHGRAVPSVAPALQTLVRVAAIHDHATGAAPTVSQIDFVLRAETMRQRPLPAHAVAAAADGGTGGGSLSNGPKLR